MKIIDIYTPEGIRNRDLAHELVNLHKQMHDDDAYRHIWCRKIETLVVRLCEKHGWAWEIHKDRENDIEAILD